MRSFRWSSEPAEYPLSRAPCTAREQGARTRPNWPINQPALVFSGRVAGRGSLAALAQQTAERPPPRFGVVTLQVRQVEAVNQRVSRDWPGERAGELEGRPESQAHQRCPGDPRPATRATQLSVNDAKRGRLQP